MEPVSIITVMLTSMGYGAVVPVLLAGVGLFSALSVVYPAGWRGAATIQKLALLVGNAKPKPTAS